LQLAGNQLLGILKIPVVVQYNTVGIWLPVPVVIYFQSLVLSTYITQKQLFRDQETTGTRRIFSPTLEISIKRLNKGEGPAI
jgi:hypothetical protein